MCERDERVYKFFFIIVYFQSPEAYFAGTPGMWSEIESISYRLNGKQIYEQKSDYKIREILIIKHE